MSFEPEYEYRSGIGSDIHRFAAGRPLMLGGIEVPWNQGLLAHSDGDVVLHAVIDALLGAAGLGDIGTLFPDTDEKYLGIDSKQLVAAVKQQLDTAGWQIVNIDIIIQAEQPRLGPLKGQMKRAISSMLGMDFTAVNVKAKTNEGLGEIGEGLAIGAMASTLLRRRIKRRL